MKPAIYKSKKQWYFRVVDPSNGETLAQSEGYHNKVDCYSTYEKVTNKGNIQMIKNDLQMLINRISDIQIGRK